MKADTTPLTQKRATSLFTIAARRLGLHAGIEIVRATPFRPVAREVFDRTVQSVDGSISRYLQRLRVRALRESKPLASAPGALPVAKV